MKGAGAVVVSENAGGLDAIAHARRQVRKGARLVVTGGMDGSICPWGWVAQLASARLSTSVDCGRAYLPFDARAAGHVPAEGGALLTLESPASARERGARVYGEIAGYASTFDAVVDPEAGRGLRRAIEIALSDAGLGAGDVDVVFADGAAIPELDRAEAAALATVFGPRGVPVTVPKTTSGRLCSGAAPLDVVSALLAIRDRVIPPTINVSPRPEYELDLVVDQPRSADIATAVVLARGYGGFNSALVVQRTTT